jgi:hypothetical protein
MEDTLLRASRAFPAVVLTGPRRAGKTTLLRKLFPSASYALLEDPDVISRVRADPRSLLAELRPPVILDEIQNTPELFSYVRSQIDAKPSSRGRWFLTGSQDATLMRGVSESLAGRAAILSLLPLSVLETPRVSLLRGGYPEAVARPGASGLWFRSYLQTYLERDVRSVSAIGDLALDMDYELGGGPEALRQQEIRQVFEEDRPIAKEAPIEGVMAVCIDATKVRENLGKKRTRGKSKRYKIGFKDAKVATFSEVQWDPRRGEARCVHSSYVSAVEKADEFFGRIWVEMPRRGLDPEMQPLVFLGDGADWIWRRVKRGRTPVEHVPEEQPPADGLSALPAHGTPHRQRDRGERLQERHRGPDEAGGHDVVPVWRRWHASDPQLPGEWSVRVRLPRSARCLSAYPRNGSAPQRQWRVDCGRVCPQTPDDVWGLRIRRAR